MTGSYEEPQTYLLVTHSILDNDIHVKTTQNWHAELYCEFGFIVLL